MKAKYEIRRQILELRRALTPEYIQERSHMIEEKIIQHSRYQQAQVLLCYISTQGEVCMKELIQHAWKSGKIVAVPRVSGRDMEFYEISSLDELENGTYGIMEPIRTCSRAEYNEKDSVMVIPGIAFDYEGNRIGYGGGYYDRYLSSRRGIYKFAPAFSMQIVPRIWNESHDMRVDCLVSEEKVMECVRY